MTVPALNPRSSGALAVVRRAVATPVDALLSALTAIMAIAIGIPLSRWALLDAVWTGTAGR